jgi:hypothetical protein
VGFTEPERLGSIGFTDGPYAGAEVSVRDNVGIGVLREIEALGNTPDETSVEDKIARYERLCDLFGTEVLRGWNVEGPDGEPRPANAEGCRLIGADFLGTVVVLYLAGIRQAPPPLPSGSPAPEKAKRPRKRSRGK